MPDLEVDQNLQQQPAAPPVEPVQTEPPNSDAAPVCDVSDCGEHAVQQFTTDAGNGVTVSRCEIHAVPGYDIPKTWVFTLPPPADPEK